MTFDRAKFKALVHYIVWRCPDGSRLGATKLNKILWLSDMRFYMLHGRSITGATYVKRQFGPVPNSIMPIREELQQEGALSIWRDEKFAGSYGKDVFRSLRAPDTFLFSKDELDTANFWIREVCDNHTAATISEETHDYVWEIAELGEAIPMSAIFATRLRESNAEELEWARQEAKRLKLVE